MYGYYREKLHVNHMLVTCFHFIFLGGPLKINWPWSVMVLELIIRTFREEVRIDEFEALTSSPPPPPPKPGNPLDI